MGWHSRGSSNYILPDRLTGPRYLIFLEQVLPELLDSAKLVLPCGSSKMEPRWLKEFCKGQNSVQDEEHTGRSRSAVAHLLGVNLPSSSHIAVTLKYEYSGPHSKLKLPSLSEDGHTKMPWRSTGPLRLT
ncbi:hypothetical protein TNCV_3503601 [Trichonephila clavipes]|uniref:Uncharacterized protein n=1 Tax=Trichonephila clavipes TaxID=2585209 RepID=A0A8X6V7S5_TRICX|nr:hypothetical protein TNCV_3503601 [Trichonephila clavipes]